MHFTHFIPLSLSLSSPFSTLLVLTRSASSRATQSYGINESTAKCLRIECWAQQNEHWTRVREFHSLFVVLVLCSIACTHFMHSFGLFLPWDQVFLCVPLSRFSGFFLLFFNNSERWKKKCRKLAFNTGCVINSTFSWLSLDLEYNGHSRSLCINTWIRGIFYFRFFGSNLITCSSIYFLLVRLSLVRRSFWMNWTTEVGRALHLLWREFHNMRYAIALYILQCLFGPREKMISLLPPGIGQKSSLNRSNAHFIRFKKAKWNLNRTYSKPTTIKHARTHIFFSQA